MDNPHLPRTPDNNTSTIGDTRLSPPNTTPIHPNKRNQTTLKKCILLISFSLGLGVFILPHLFADVGWLGGVVILALGCITSYFSLHLYMRTSEYCDISNYLKLSKHILGDKLSFFVCLTILVYHIGSLSACFSIFSDYLVQVLNVIIGTLITTEYSHLVLIRQVLYFLILFLLIAGYSATASHSTSTTLKTINNANQNKKRHDQYFSWIHVLASIGSILFVVMLILFNYFSVPVQKDINTSAFVWGWRWVTTFNTMALGFSVHFSIYSNHHAALISHYRSDDSSIRLTYIFNFLVYLICGITGYFHFGDSVNENILISDSISPMYMVARMFILFHIMISLTDQVYPCCLCLKFLMKESSRSQPNMQTHHDSRACDSASLEPPNAKNDLQKMVKVLSAAKSEPTRDTRRPSLIALMMTSSLLSKNDKSEATNSKSSLSKTLKFDKKQYATTKILDTSLPRSSFAHQSSVTSISTTDSLTDTSPLLDHNQKPTVSPLRRPRAYTTSNHLECTRQPLDGSPKPKILDSGTSHSDPETAPSSVSSLHKPKKMGTIQVPLILIFAWTVSTLIPSFDRMLSLTGSLAGSLITYVFPATFYLICVVPGSSPALNFLAWLILALGISLFTFGSFYSIIQAF